MNILIKSATLLDPASALHRQKVHLVVREGKIDALQAATQEIPTGPFDRTLSGDALHVSAGWFDLQAHFCDPGLEHREDLRTGAQTAAASGFTGVALLPNTEPVVQTKNEVRYIVGASDGLVQLHPLAAATHGAQGEALTEMIDLHHAGAVAFTDGLHALQHRQVLLKALQYGQKFDGLLINRPEDTQLTAYGTMHEGVTSTRLGLRGMPALAETIALERDLRLLAYATEFAYAYPPRLHVSNLSAVASVELVRRAKAQGLAVSCDVAAHQLVFDDSSLLSFDTNYKVNPPLRSPDDRHALREGVADGTIDAIVSAHRPLDEESKKCEFDLAEFGMLGLPAVLPVVSQLVDEGFSLPTLIEALTSRPRQVLKLPLPRIEKGEMANLTVFDPTAKWAWNQATNFSKSSNHPWYGQTVRGQVRAVFHRGQQYVAEETTAS
jgi:dihydroorotase